MALPLLAKSLWTYGWSRTLPLTTTLLHSFTIAAALKSSVWQPYLEASRGEKGEEATPGTTRTRLSVRGVGPVNPITVIFAVSLTVATHTRPSANVTETGLQGAEEARWAASPVMRWDARLSMVDWSIILPGQTVGVAVRACTDPFSSGF